MNIFKRLFPSKEMREYRKLHRKHTKELLNVVRRNRDFDYGWLDEFVHLKIRHMYEYFLEGNNVYQTEESKNIILEQLKHVLDMYDELDNLWNTDKSYVDKRQRELELFQEIYSYIGKYIQWWWD